MSLIGCARCDRMTNTALSDWVQNVTGKASRCYAAWDTERGCWVEGCGINDEDVDVGLVEFAKKIIRKEV